MPPPSDFPPAPPAQLKPLPFAGRRSRGGGGIAVIYEDPFVVRIPLKGVSLLSGGIPRHRASSRTPKRKRITYKELADTDSDDFLTDSDQEKVSSSRASKKGRKLSKSSTAATYSAPTAKSQPAAIIQSLTDPAPSAATELLALNDTSVESPPPGTLSTLWYSREVFLNVFVLEKVLAWKTRHVTQLEWVAENFPEGEKPPPFPPTIDPAEAAKLSSFALTNPTVWFDPRKRMDVSRLLPENCPIVMALAAAREFQETNGKPKFIMKQVDSDKHREEVHLVKWRGRSHLHVSWERGSDIIKYDQSNNTARHKIRRFVQSQEIAYGMNWKQVLEEERTTTAAIHAHGATDANPDDDVAQVEEYYPPAYAEIERILACDESEMDLTLFAKQRALNMRAEQEQVRERELDESERKKWNSQQGLEEILNPIPWDPEDNVRYVVKWKGLPFAEMTWEYWRDIKRDAVDFAEDFWIRQQPPSQQDIAATTKPHPHMREFRKIAESPEFGISDRKRSVADLGDGFKDDDDELEIKQGLKLRSYQLEGVNWLLFNWWNKRSCILADGELELNDLSILYLRCATHNLYSHVIRRPLRNGIRVRIRTVSDCYIWRQLESKLTFFQPG